MTLSRYAAYIILLQVHDTIFASIEIADDTDFSGATLIKGANFIGV